MLLLEKYKKKLSLDVRGYLGICGEWGRIFLLGDREQIWRRGSILRTYPAPLTSLAKL
jgi:hypothetical protein